MQRDQASESAKELQKAAAVYGKFMDSDNANEKKPTAQIQELDENESSDETNLETCRGGADELSSKPHQSHSSLLSYYKRERSNDPREEDKQGSSSSANRQSRQKSNESTVSFDTWAFAISDSRTVVKNA